jgi:hypothetical protein
MKNQKSLNHKKVILYILFLSFISSYNLLADEIPKVCNANKFSTPCLLQLHRNNILRFSDILNNESLSSNDTNVKLLLGVLKDTNLRNFDIISEIDNYYYLEKFVTDKGKYIEFQDFLRTQKILRASEINLKIEENKSYIKFTDKKLEKLFLLNIENLKQTTLILKNSDSF